MMKFNFLQSGGLAPNCQLLLAGRTSLVTGGWIKAQATFKGQNSPLAIIQSATVLLRIFFAVVLVLIVCSGTILFTFLLLKPASLSHVHNLAESDP